MNSFLRQWISKIRVCNIPLSSGKPRLLRPTARFSESRSLTWAQESAFHKFPENADAVILGTMLLKLFPRVSIKTSLLSAYSILFFHSKHKVPWRIPWKGSQARHPLIFIYPFELWDAFLWIIIIQHLSEINYLFKKSLIGLEVHLASHFSLNIIKLISSLLFSHFSLCPSLWSSWNEEY